MSHNRAINGESEFEPKSSEKLDYMRIKLRLNIEKEEKAKLKAELNKLIAEQRVQQAKREKEIQEIQANLKHLDELIGDAKEEKKALTVQLASVSALHNKIDGLEGAVLLEGFSGVIPAHSALELKAIDGQRDVLNAQLASLRSREDLQSALSSVEVKIKAINEKKLVENSNIHDTSKLQSEAQLSQNISSVRARISDAREKQELVKTILSKAKEDLYNPINNPKNLEHFLMGANDEKRTGTPDKIELDKEGKKLLQKIQVHRQSLFPSIHSDKKARDKDLVLQQYADYIQGRSDKNKVEAAKAHGTSWALRRSIFFGNKTFGSTTKNLCDAVDEYQRKRSGL